MIRQCLRTAGHDEALPHIYGERITQLSADPTRCQDFIRSALLPPAPDIASAIRATIGPEGVDDKNEPLNASPLEQEANQRIKESSMSPVPPAQNDVPTDPGVSGGLVPLVPEHLVKIATAVGVFLMAMAAVVSNFDLGLPVPMELIASIIGAAGAVALYLAGKGAPQILAGKPLIPLALVPVCLTLSVACGGIASKLPPGKAQTALLLASAILGYLAGRGQPAPVVVEGTVVSRS